MSSTTNHYHSVQYAESILYDEFIVLGYGKPLPLCTDGESISSTMDLSFSDLEMVLWLVILRSSLM